MSILKIKDQNNNWQSIPAMKGDPGVSPAVTVDTIQGGHQVTITDATHPLGQSFNVMDGQDVLWSEVANAVLEEDSAVSGVSFNFTKPYKKLKIIGLFPTNNNVSSSTSCYMGMTCQDGSTTLIYGSAPIQTKWVRVIAEYTYDEVLGWQGEFSQFSMSGTGNEDGNNTYTKYTTNIRGKDLGLVTSIRLYGDDTPLIAGTKIKIYGK